MAKGAEKQSEKESQTCLQEGESPFQGEAFELLKDASKAGKHGEKKERSQASITAAANEIADGDFDAAAISQQMFPHLFDMNGISREKQAIRIDSIQAGINGVLEDADSQYRVRFGQNSIKTPGGTNLEIYDELNGNTVDSLNFVIPNYQWR